MLIQHLVKLTIRFIFSMSKRRFFSGRSSILKARVSPSWKQQIGFLVRMLPCEKSVGGIPTRRTLSPNPEENRGPLKFQALHRLLSLHFFSSFSSASFCSSSSRILVRRGGQGASVRNDSFRGARVATRAAWIPKDDDQHQRTNEQMNERTHKRRNERNFLARDACLLGICEYILFNPFPRARD